MGDLMTVSQLIACLKAFPSDSVVVLNADRNELANGRPVGRLEGGPAVYKSKDDIYSMISVGLWDEEDEREYGYEGRQIVNLTPN